MALGVQKAQGRQCRCAVKASQSGLISITQGVNASKTNAGVGRKTTPHWSASQLAREKSYWHPGGRKPAPGRGLQGAGDRLGKRGQDTESQEPSVPAPQPQGPLCARPVSSPWPVNLRCPAAAMCAARTPQLALIFRGTFVHSTWTCPMEVLRDHLLGVSDSGKVSGYRVPRTADRWRDPGKAPRIRSSLL